MVHVTWMKANPPSNSNVSFSNSIIDQWFWSVVWIPGVPLWRNCYLLEGACRIPKHQPRPPNTTNYNLQPHVFPVFGDKFINPIYSMERIEGGMSLSETELTDSRNPASPSPWVALWVSGAPKVWMDMDAKIAQSPGGHFKGNVNVYISI